MAGVSSSPLLAQFGSCVHMNATAVTRAEVSLLVDITSEEANPCSSAVVAGVLKCLFPLNDFEFYLKLD